MSLVVKKANQVEIGDQLSIGDNLVEVIGVRIKDDELALVLRNVLEETAKRKHMMLIMQEKTELTIIAKGINHA